jgi:hypothetical protein
MPMKEKEAGRKACREAARAALASILKEPRKLPDSEGQPLPAGKG